MKLCWIVVLVGISIILVFLYSLVAMPEKCLACMEVKKSGCALSATILLLV